MWLVWQADQAMVAEGRRAIQVLPHVQGCRQSVEFAKTRSSCKVATSCLFHRALNSPTVDSSIPQTLKNAVDSRVRNLAAYSNQGEADSD